MLKRNIIILIISLIFSLGFCAVIVKWYDWKLLVILFVWTWINNISTLRR